MNNTTATTLTIAAILAATLVVGVTLATTTTTAFVFKKGNEGSKDGNTVTAQINAQRGSVSGFDGSFEQEAQNLICTHPGNNATCIEEGSTTASAAAAAAAKRTCEQCFKTFLTPDQITGVLNGRTPESACPVFRGGLVLSESEFRGALGDAKVNPTIANELIACLRDAGVVFGP